MTAQEFAIWLQGYVELGGKTPDDAQWKLITEHLKLVFNKVTPELGDKSVWEDKKVDSPVGATIEEIKKIFDDAKAVPLPYYPPSGMPAPYNPNQWVYDPNRTVITC